MKVYHVQYIGSDDLTYHEYFTSKIVANKRQSELKKEENKTYNEINGDEDENDSIASTVKMVFDMYTFSFQLSKKGVIDMLNNYFNETQ